MIINRSRDIQSLEPVYDYDGKVRVFGHVLAELKPMSFFKVIHTPRGWGAIPFDEPAGAFYVGVSPDFLDSGFAWFIIGGLVGPFLLPEVEEGQTLAVKDGMLAYEPGPYLSPRGFAFVVKAKDNFANVMLAPREVRDDSFSTD